jgi:pathogenesis-related protein 1
LSWSQDLAASALVNAQANADTGALRHTVNPPYGQNLAKWSGYGSSINPYAFADSLWAAEAKDYDCATGRPKTPGAVTGHFTQQVWRGSTQVGCASVTKNGATFVTCDYSPPGNYVGQYTSQVICPK